MSKFHQMLVVLFLSGCGPSTTEMDAQDEQDAQAEEALQGGHRTGAYAAVGLLVMQSGAFCSGTLIRPEVVLTAAHCVDEPLLGFYLGHGEEIVNDAESMQQLLSTMDGYGVADARTHHAYETHNCGGSPDLALVLLSSPVEGVKPVKVAGRKVAKSGKVCTAVGFGAHDGDNGTTVGRKRAGTEQILRVSTRSVAVRKGSAIADHGDSGGPLLCGRKIAGVTSCGDNDAPSQRIVFYARPDMETAWIRSVLLEWGM